LSVELAGEDCSGDLPPELGMTERQQLSYSAHRLFHFSPIYVHDVAEWYAAAKYLLTSPSALAGMMEK